MNPRCTKEDPYGEQSLSTDKALSLCNSVLYYYYYYYLEKKLPSDSDPKAVVCIIYRGVGPMTSGGGGGEGRLQPGGQGQVHIEARMTGESATGWNPSRGVWWNATLVKLINI